MKQDEQVGRAVVVNVLDGTHASARRWAEVLDKIDLVVEVAILLPAYEYSAFVILVHIRSAIEVGIEDHFGELALTIVHAPDVGPAVAVPIFGGEEGGTWRQRPGCRRCARHNAQERCERTLEPSVQWNEAYKS